MGENIVCSIIIPVLESYEAVRRQILYMNDLGIPENFEVIFIDDGSQPPIFGQDMVEIPIPEFDFKYGYRADFRPFTKACASNEGVNIAHGEWVWLFAIDWMITKEMMDFISSYDGDSMITPTIKFATLDEKGKLNIVGKKTHYGIVGLSAIKKDRYMALGGYDEKLTGYYPTGDDIDFGLRYFAKYGRQDFLFGSLIYGFPKDEKVDVIPNCMEEDGLDGLRPDIFYISDFNDWKLKQAEHYWNKRFNPEIEHSELANA